MSENSFQADYWTAYFEAVAAGETRNSFAKRMGVPASRVYQRTFEKQKAGWEIPHLVAEKPRQKRSEFAELAAKFGYKRGGAE